MENNAFTVRRIATTGHEILAPQGNVVAWAVDEPWALMIAGLLNRVEAEGLYGLIGVAGEGDGLRGPGHDCKQKQQEGKEATS
jgi:hypothetical protein